MAQLATEKTFEQILHKASAGTGQGLSAMVQKDRAAQKAAVADYFQHWDNKTEDETDATQSRIAAYDSLTRQYYNLATDFYEYGWGQSFHFCRFAPRESFAQALARHEHYLAHTIGITDGMRVLDVGCGVGGPARAIASFTGCHVTGLNINAYQVERARRYAVQDGLSDQLAFVQGDFMNIPFPDNSFDAVYAIEATVHAPSLAAVYAEIYRVLKPGSVFGVYEWAMTDTYDHQQLAHRQICRAIEQGDGIAHMVTASDAVSAMKTAGFSLRAHEDLAARPDYSPWYWPLDGAGWRHAQSLSDLVVTLRMSRVGRTLAHGFLAALETVCLAPPGTKKTGDSLAEAAEGLVRGGKERLFTPMYLMVGEKQ